MKEAWGFTKGFIKEKKLVRMAFIRVLCENRKANFVTFSLDAVSTHNRNAFLYFVF
jgi:hypothetical protein